MMHFAATLLLVTTAVIHSSPGSVSTTINSLPLYKQAQAPIEQRVHDLVSRMTIDEKVAQMLGDGGGARIYRGHRPVDKFKETGVGSAGNQVRKLEDLHAQNALQAAMINSSRLGIPIDFTAETLHSGGHAGCTVFPMPCLQGSSWNVTLVQKIAASNALQARASGTNHGLSPVINVATDPRFGRTQESFSEDPFIVGTMAVAAVLGNQGQDGAGGPNSYLGSPRTTMISQAKHFYAYDHGGRDGAQTLLDERSLFETYARPWERAVKKAGLRGVMASHQMVNYEPMHGSHRRLTSLLRDELGFGPGYIAADAANVAALYTNQMVASSFEAAAALAATAGLDQDLSGMVDTPYMTLAKQKPRTPALDAAIDRAAGNVLRLKFAAGLFDSPLADPSLWHERDSPKARQLALEAAEEGIVLLINRNKALPLSKAPGVLKQIAVIGPLADDKDSTLGDYNPKADVSEQAWGSGSEVVTVLGGIQNYVKQSRLGATVTSAEGCNITLGPINETRLTEAVALHKASDVTVLVVGDSSGGSVGYGSESCGEGSDRHNLDLFGQQMALVNALVAANSTSKLIVVLVHGRAQTFGPDNLILAKVDAMLAAWRPGEEGGTACARIIFGDVSPSGKLTQAWPTDVGGVNSPGNPWSQPYQADGSDTKTASGPIPASYHDGDSGATQVLFPMGFGLSFSRFNYSQPTIAHGGSATKLSANQSIAVLVTVQNVGDIVAATIVQVYAAASSPGMTLGISRNQRVLVGFIKLRLRAGETAVAKVQVEMADMGRYDPYAHKWVVDAGPYTLFAQDCAGSRWDAYLIHGSPQWQGVGCTVMGSTQVTIA